MGGPGGISGRGRSCSPVYVKWRRPLRGDALWGPWIQRRGSMSLKGRPLVDGTYLVGEGCRSDSPHPYDRWGGSGCGSSSVGTKTGHFDSGFSARGVGRGQRTSGDTETASSVVTGSRPRILLDVHGHCLCFRVSSAPTRFGRWVLGPPDCPLGSDAPRRDGCSGLGQRDYTGCPPGTSTGDEWVVDGGEGRGLVSTGVDGDGVNHGKRRWRRRTLWESEGVRRFRG